MSLFGGNSHSISEEEIDEWVHITLIILLLPNNYLNTAMQEFFVFKLAYATGKLFKDRVTIFWMVFLLSLWNFFILYLFEHFVTNIHTYINT